MKQVVSIGVFMLVLAVGAFGQDVTAPAAEPQYSAAFGLGFNHYDAPQIKGWAAFETRIATGVYNVTTLNMTSKLATLATGVKKNFYVSGPVALFALADLGVATGEGATVATAGGGGGIKLAGSGLSKIPWAKAFASVPGSYVVAAVKIQQTGGQGVSPTFSFGFGVDFR